MRLRFNAVPMDQPGRYIYLHDHDEQGLLVRLVAAGGQAAR